jgi:tetrahydromethanopterin S-methyltransferase subunit A
MNSNASWPVIAGSYVVGDPQGAVAVCVNTSEQMIDPLAHLPGVAITGKVYTANLGIERIVTNIIANPAIRFLLLCGKDSLLFRPGQSLVALAEQGRDEQRRIIGALGYEPVLPTLTAAQIAQFRRQVEVIDWTGEEDLSALEPRISSLVARNPGPFISGEETTTMTPREERFVPIRPGGQREPLQYDPKGYFVITVDRAGEQIILRHYLPDHTPAHEMRGRSADPMLLGLLREGLVTQLSHAGYLGEELAKAQVALLHGWRYEQDRPLRPPETVAASAAAAPPAALPASGAMPAAAGAPPSMAQIQPPLTWSQWQTTAPGANVDVVIAVTAQPSTDLLVGAFLEADEAEPFSVYRRTAHQLQLHWSAATRLIMGEPADIQVGTLLRVRGALGADQTVDARQLVVLTRVARLVEP